MTYRTLINIESKRAELLGKEKEAIKILTLELSGLNGAEFYSAYDEEIGEEKETIIQEAINRYLVDNIPVQYILGYSYFFGYPFDVDENVLIPRPETEELVSYVLAEYDHYFSGEEVTVVDIGTGSGAIAITLAKEEPLMKVHATDISQPALVVAKKNAQKLGAEVEFIAGDLLQPLIVRELKFDILVSNPPYIPKKEEVQSIVKDNEPHIALFGGETGLYFYEQILANAHKILKPKNIIAFEHSYSQKKEMLTIAAKYFPQGKARVIQDMFGKDRIMIIVNDDKDD